MTDPSTPAHAPAVQGEDVSPGLQRAIDETCVAIRAAFDSDSVPTKNLALRRAHDRIARLTAELKEARAALTAIAGFGSVNLAGEYEHSLRDIIRSMTDCAKRSLNSPKCD